jgi:hypothetical protein
MKLPWCIGALSTLLLTASPAAEVVPAGTVLEVRLTSEVSSDKPSGSPVEGVIIAPVLMNGQPVISAGTRVTGVTADANPAQTAAQGTAEKSATLRLQFTKIVDRQGHEQPIDCVLESVDNARETVNAAGVITGIVPSQTYEARIDQGIGKLTNQHEGLAGLLTSVKGALLKQVDPSIDYKPGVEVTVKLTKALDWSWPPVGETVVPVNPAAALVQLVNSVPLQTIAQNPPKPSDITNLMFIGTAAQVQTAFQEAGWFTAAARDRGSEFETARAMIESRGYSEAPVSTLYLNGKPPDLTFEKQNNTFDKRHHIRIWLQSEQFQGKPVWMAAATHDISIVFSS